MTREGTRAGRWVARYPLGEGGGGSVWFAQPADGDRDSAGVAIKFYPALRTSREEFRREAAVAMRNRHENLLRLVDAGVLDDDTPWLALEHVDGEDLRARLERGVPGTPGMGVPAGATIGPVDAVRIGIQVFAALDAMHRAGLAHGDVKPENLLLQGELVRLVDFGRARLHHLYGDAAVFPGTPPYMHPALFKGGAPTPRTDCFAAWVTVYECVVGLRPFHPRQLSAPAAGEGEAIPPWRGLLDPALDRLVEAGFRGTLPDARSAWVALERYLRGREDFPSPLPTLPDPPTDVVERALALARSGVGVALTSDGQAAGRALGLAHRGWALRGGTVLWARAGWGSPDTPMSGALGFASHAADGLAEEDLARIADELGPRAAAIVAASPSTRAWLRADVLPGPGPAPRGLALAAVADELDRALRAFCAACPKPLLLLVEGLDRLDGTSRRFLAGLALPGVVVIGSSEPGAPHGLARELEVADAVPPAADLDALEPRVASLVRRAVVLGLPFGPELAVAAAEPGAFVDEAALEAEGCGAATWDGVAVRARPAPVDAVEARAFAREAGRRLDAATSPLLVARCAVAAGDTERLHAVLDVAVEQAMRRDPAVALQILLGDPEHRSRSRILSTFHVAVLARNMEVASGLLGLILADPGLSAADRAEAEAEFAFRTGQIQPALKAYRRVAAELGRPLHDGIRGVVQDLVALWGVWRERPPTPRPDRRLARVFERLHDLHFTSDNGPMLRIHALWRAAAPAEPRVVAMDVVWNVALGRKERAMRVHDALWKEVSEDADPAGAAILLLHRAIARSWTGDVAGSYVDALDAAERLLRVGDPYLAGLAVATVAVCVFHVGDPGPLRRISTRLGHLVHDTGDVRSGGWVMVMRAQLAWHEGRQADAVALAHRAILEAEARDDSTVVLARRFLGELLLEEGHHVRATAVLLKGWAERRRYHIQMDFIDALAIDLLVADGQARVAGGRGLVMRWRYSNAVALLLRRSPRWRSRALVASAWQALAANKRMRADTLFEDAHVVALHGALYSDAWSALQHAALAPGPDRDARLERATLFARAHGLRVPYLGEPDAQLERR